MDKHNKKMAFLLATDSWTKMDVYQDFLVKKLKVTWRMGGAYTTQYISQIEVPINIYFFHRNVIKYRAVCKSISHKTPALSEIPLIYQHRDPPPYTIFLELRKVERIFDKPISSFPKWSNPKECYKRGQLGLLKVVDMLENCA